MYLIIKNVWFNTISDKKKRFKTIGLKNEFGLTNPNVWLSQNNSVVLRKNLQNFDNWYIQNCSIHFNIYVSISISRSFALSTIVIKPWKDSSYQLFYCDTLWRKGHKKIIDYSYDNFTLIKSSLFLIYKIKISSIELIKT